MRTSSLVLMVGCASIPVGAPTPDDAIGAPPFDDASVSVEGERVPLAPMEQLHRVSVALRGIKPSMDDLDRVADDPRFSLCTAQRFYGFFGAMSPDEVPLQTAAALQRTFVDSGYDAKALARAVVLSDTFLAAYSTDPEDDATLPGLLVVRPRQQARSIEDLTGFRWLSDTSVDDLPCSDRCWGEIDRAIHNGHGFQSMSGGSDGYRITRAIDTVTPIKTLFSAALAEEAAAWVVRADFEHGEDRLLAGVDPDEEDEALIRATLDDLYLRVLGAAASETDLDGLHRLYADAALRSGPLEGWQVVVAALLQHPRILFY